MGIKFESIRLFKQVEASDIQVGFIHTLITFDAWYYM